MLFRLDNIIQSNYNIRVKERGIAMDIKKILKIIGAIAAIAGVAVAVYLAVKKIMGTKEPEYFDDNDFFECDNEIEIVEAKKEETVVEEAPAQEEAPKKTASKKTTKKTVKKEN